MRMLKSKSAISKTAAIVVAIVIIVAAVGGTVAYMATLPPPTPTPTQTPTPGPTPTPKKELKILFAAADPPNNFWCMHMTTGARVAEAYIEEKYGVEADIKEAYSIKPSDAPYVFKSYSNEGYKLQIITVQFAPLLEDIGKENPDTNFLCVYVPPPFDLPNIGGYDQRDNEACFLAGVLSGMVTKTNVIGYVVAFDIPAAAFKYNCFLEGVKYVNPEAKVPYTITNDWNDVSKGAAAADTLIGMGADVIFGWGNSQAEGAVTEAARRGVYSIAHIGDLAYMAPDHILASVYINQTTYWVLFMEDALKGESGQKWYSPTIEENGENLLINDRLVEAGVITSDMLAKIDEAKKGLADGTIVLPEFGVPFPKPS